jgi:GntR family transcriptional repressor for pyruvate dehydrogenase complex
MLGVGRTTLRESLRTLQSEGRLRVRAGSGAYVTAPGQGVALGQWAERLDATVEALLQVRLLLEPPAAALAAAAALTIGEKETALRPPLESLLRATGETELERRVAADLAFHAAVARLAGNSFLLATLEHLSTLLAESLRVGLRDARRLARVHAAHSRICDAILAGDPDAAARAMAMHLALFGSEMGLGRTTSVVPATSWSLVSVEDLLENQKARPVHADAALPLETQSGGSA